MYKIILAFDSFKGSASSKEIGTFVKQQIKIEMPQIEVQPILIADGGEGTLDAIASSMNAHEQYCDSYDPLNREIISKYMITDDGDTGIIELAKTSGLPLLSREERNPLITSTYGTGVVIMDALKRGCHNILLGIGGSATNDVGTGILHALGVHFIDSNGKRLQPCGENLTKIVQIDTNHLSPLAVKANFIIACDVNNPLYGSNGAAHVFAPQKGADNKIVESLDKGLYHYANLIDEIYHIDINSIPGAGAAGGVGGGLLPFLSCQLKSGIDIILDLSRFDEIIKDTDLIFTGEGRIDIQTGMGKALNGILKRAKSKSIPVIALAGSVENIKELNALGFTSVFSIQKGPITLEDAMQPATTLNGIANTIIQILRLKAFTG